MKQCRLNKVENEMHRLAATIDILNSVGGGNSNSGCYPIESGAVRRASMDLTRALANLRKSDYEKLAGE